MLDSSKILVIGDVMLDVYINGEVNRISPEAPVPVMKKNSERYVLGGASNVASNLAAASQKVSILAMIGNDSKGKIIRSLFEEIGVDLSFLFTWKRPTITKTRFLAENNQQVFRLDIEETQPISTDEENHMISLLKRHIDEYDYIIISDYMKGLLTYDFTQKIIKCASEHEKKVIIDVKDANYEKYKGAWLLKPNRKELKELTRMPVSTDEELIEAARFLMKSSESEYVLTTCGAKGMVLVGKGLTYHLDIIGKTVYDVTGAGDTTIAYLTAALASGLELKAAMNIANHAAGIQVGKVGTSAVYLHEVEQDISFETIEEKQKVFNLHERERMMECVRRWRENGDVIVTTNGCFDIIHKGHISMLEHAKTYGDKLIVLINTDDSVKRLKGADRPINSEEDRATVLAALKCVDAVVLFNPQTDNKMIPNNEWEEFDSNLKKTAIESPIGIMKMIVPDIHVKGGDYSIDQVPEAKYARDFISVPYIQGYSTTKTIAKSKISNQNI